MKSGLVGPVHTKKATMVTTQPLSFNATDRLRAPSFSSYLNSPEKTILGKLAQDPNSLFHGAKKVEEEGEIGVFRAEKYFHGLMSEDNQRASNNLKPNFHPRTSFTYSESSWNSQSGLLRSAKRNPRQRKGKNLISSLGCGCSCDGKNSDVIDEKDKERNSRRSLSSGAFRGKMGKQESAKTGSDPVDLARIKRSGLDPRVMEEIHCRKREEMGNGLGREECFSFPILNSTPGGNPSPINSQGNQEGKQRNSWEAFGPYVLDKKNKNFLILEGKNPTMWGWGTDSRAAEEFEIPRRSDAMYDDDDNGSEASSDLFEIESFTNPGNSFHGRNGSDGMSSCVTHTTCYAPSSMEWSVVTASAAEFSSVISDSEELVKNPKGLVNPRKMGPDGKFSAGGKEMEKRRPGNLLGCKSLKAVRVAQDAYVRSKKGNLDLRTQYRSSREGKGN